MICIDGTGLDNPVVRTRGIGFYIKNLIENVTPVLSNKATVLRNSDLYIKEGDILLRLFNIPERIHWLLNRFILPNLLSKKKIDVFHSTHPYTLTVTDKYITIATVYDIIPHIFYDYYLKDKKINAKASYNYYLKAISKAAHIIAISSQTKSDLIQYLKINPEKITVIHLAVDKTIFSYKADRAFFFPLYQKHKLPQKYFLYVGGADFRKNLKTLIKAYSLVADKIEESLVLVGTWYDVWVQNLNKELAILNLSNRVIFLSYIADEDMCGVYSLSTALLFPSLYEGFGFPVLEAFTCGTPVLCSNNSSLIEIAEDCAHTVTPTSEREIADGILLLAKDASYRASLVTKGLQKSEEFSIEKMCQETMIVYEKFAQGFYNA